VQSVTVYPGVRHSRSTTAAYAALVDHMGLAGSGTEAGPPPGISGIGLDRKGRAAQDSVRCKVCGEASVRFSSALVLSKYQVTYFRCDHCGFVQTEEPYWLDEAYSEAVSSYDIGTINRAFVNSSRCEEYILRYFDCNAKFVDYGAGYGALVRRMRDMGYDFYWHDKFCKNLFALHFEADTSGATRYELLTAFEVFEHMANPREEFERMLGMADGILAGTELIPETNPRPGEWSYYFPLHGQHIAFYARKTLTFLAETYRLHLLTDGRSYHLFTKKPLRRLPIRDRLRVSLARDIRSLRYKLSKQSLLMDDFRDGQQSKPAD
jgi:hypothetical protein